MNNDKQQLHTQAWDLIPWLVNGRASAQQRDMVLTHIGTCAQCQEELGFQEQLKQGLQEPANSQFDVESNLNRFWARVDAQGHAPLIPQTAAPDNKGDPISNTPRKRNWAAAVAAVLVIQSLGLLTLAGQRWGQAPQASYQTFSAQESTGAKARIRLVADPRMSIGQLRELLDRGNLQLVHTNENASILGVAPTNNLSFQQADTLALLRANPMILLAEPIHP